MTYTTFMQTFGHFLKMSSELQLALDKHVVEDIVSVITRVRTVYAMDIHNLPNSEFRESGLLKLTVEVMCIPMLVTDWHIVKEALWYSMLR